MIFPKKLVSRINFFIDNLDSNVLEIFTIGFYQLLDKEMRLYNLDSLKKDIVYFLENIESINNIVEEHKATEEIAVFLTYIGHIYASVMMLEEAILFFNESIKIRENYLKVESLKTAENYQNIGATYEQIGLFNRALEYYHKSLALRKKLSYVENNLLTAESYSRLALVYYYLNEYSTSLNYIKETVRIREKILDENHHLLESSYYNYRLIEKASRPRKDYVAILFNSVRQITGAIINRLVG